MADGEVHDDEADCVLSLSSMVTTVTSGWSTDVSGELKAMRLCEVSTSSAKLSSSLTLSKSAVLFDPPSCGTDFNDTLLSLNTVTKSSGP